IGRPATTVKVPGFEGTVILAIDVSGSMLADDVRPTRMDAAKAAAHAFIDKQRVAKNRVRIGVVAFSDNAQIVMGPTLDKVALDEKTLKQIAEATDAQYFNAQSETDLRRIYEELATTLVLRDELSEITYAVAAASAGVLLAAACLSLLWFTRLP